MIGDKASVEKKKRIFLPADLVIDSWEKIAPYFDDLLNRTFLSLDDLKLWLLHRSELEAVIEEEGAWRYIRMTIDTRREDLVSAYNFFVSEIEPQIAPYSDKLNRKLMDSPLLKSLTDPDYQIYLRSIEQEIKLFREENVLLNAEIQQESQKFGAISGQQKITYKGNELTMPRAAVFLKDLDRSVREEVFGLIVQRRQMDTEILEDLFDKLLKLRHQVAVNAGYKNYRDYMFAALGRFDYTPDDCYKFHDSIRDEILPIVIKFMEERKEKLGLDVLKPWDTDVDPEGKEPLHPFSTADELIKGAYEAMGRIHPYFGSCISTMNHMGHLDLESKDGKAPGGYNYPLYEVGVPFIFMNAVGTQRDLVTMVHEGGHAVHSFLTKDLELTAYKSLPSEVAELASMSMELFTMDTWDAFYFNEEELTRARKDQLEKILSILPWIATVDKFQHWLYLNPDHTREERKKKWLEISDEFSIGLVDYTGWESSKEFSWQRQLHIYEVPFYYIEYGMAQLGAISLWRNYRENPKNALNGYIKALSLGYTRSIPEIYSEAGIRFDFSRAYVHELSEFVKKELNRL